MVTKQELYKSLGNTLIEKGVWFAKAAFSIKPQTTTAAYLKQLVSQKTGLPLGSIWNADETYYYTDLVTIKEILKYDLSDEKQYEAEKFDCDDFAATVYAKFRYIFELNSMGFARQIEIKDAQTEQHIAWHRANIFIAMDSGELKVFCLEPQTDQIVEMNGMPPRNEAVFGNRKYVLSVVDF